MRKVGSLHHECFYNRPLPFNEDSDTLFTYIYIFTYICIYLLPIHQAAAWVPLLCTAGMAVPT